MITTLKAFGTGQITLPKAWREKFKTKHFIAQETSQGLLIKPVVEEGYFYELDSGEFGVNFPLGMDAEKVLSNLKKANGEV
jgi:bifunctional DNA-binding transcriptional regulator/antitoxin component of YhaV-PrlF toxin-antitoxin module